METMIAGLLPYIFATAGTVLTGLVPWGFVLVRKFAATKIKNALVDNALTRISHTVETVVASIFQEMVKSLTEKAADGRLSADDMAKLKTDTLTSVKTLIPAAIQANAKLAFPDLDTWISKKIDQAALKVEATAFPAFLVSGGIAATGAARITGTPDGAGA